MVGYITELQFVHPWIFYSGIGIIIGAILWHTLYCKSVRYRYPYVSLLRKWDAQEKKRFSLPILLKILRICTLVLLVIASARPQIPDDSSTLEVAGRDIVIAFDVSGSMQLFDDAHDQRSRFDVAKTEALKFIEKRKNDPIGLVLFGATAVSRCPRTLDKKLLKEIITNLSLGDIDSRGTVLSIGLGMAVNRLYTSQSASKVIILLTDGAPSEHDCQPDQILALAKKYDIKVYCIGIGSDEGGFIRHPVFGVIQQKTPLNSELLQSIADETGGAFFRAEKPDDMKQVYERINKLETSEYDTPLYSRYYDYFMGFLFAAFFIIACEVIIRWWWIIL